MKSDKSDTMRELSFRLARVERLLGEDLVPVSEFAKMCGRDARTVRRWRRVGKIRSVGNKIPRSELLKI